MYKNLIKIINEEISKTKYLDIYEYIEEEKSLAILSNEEFQKQFICDSILNKKNKIKTNVTDSVLGGNWYEDFENASYLTLYYYIEIEYKYDDNKDPAKFSLSFESDKIPITKDGYYKPPIYGGTPETSREGYGEAYFSSFDWDAIKVFLLTSDGDELNFSAYNHAPYNIQLLFLKTYLQDFIENETGMPINDIYYKKIMSSPSSYC